MADLHDVAATSCTADLTALTGVATGEVMTLDAHLALCGRAVCRSGPWRRCAAVGAASQCLLQELSGLLA